MPLNKEIWFFFAHNFDAITDRENPKLMVNFSESRTDFSDNILRL